jgi:CDP-diacylglycerol--serine O-phosphatidyltransferase
VKQTKHIPSAFTLGNLFLGLVSMRYAFEGNYEMAALLVVIGMLLDGVDGRLARMLDASSEFGKELDSLSDIVTFGVAPAFLLYVVALRDLGLLGYLVAAVFPICGAVRLARFNVTSGTPGFFTGLPITAAGGILATASLYRVYFPFWILPVIMAILAYLMVSRIQYPDLKGFKLPKSAILIIASLILIIAAVFTIKQLVFIPLLLYGLYGLNRSVSRMRAGGRLRPVRRLSNPKIKKPRN